jgi:hypothetical protein
VVLCTLHCKKKVSGFPVPSRESLVSDIPAGDEKTSKLFYSILQKSHKFIFKKFVNHIAGICLIS